MLVLKNARLRPPDAGGKKRCPALEDIVGVAERLWLDRHVGSMPCLSRYYFELVVRSLWHYVT